MERRREDRFLSDAPVRITVLGPDSGPAVSGRIVNWSGKGVKIAVPIPFEVGQAVRVEGDDLLLLGEICRVEASAVAIRVSHALHSLADLARLNRAIFVNPRVPHPGGDSRLS